MCTWSNPEPTTRIEGTLNIPKALFKKIICSPRRKGRPRLLRRRNHWRIRNVVHLPVDVLIIATMRRVGQENMGMVPVLAAHVERDSLRNPLLLVGRPTHPPMRRGGHLERTTMVTILIVTTVINVTLAPLDMPIHRMVVWSGATGTREGIRWTVVETFSRLRVGPCAHLGEGAMRFARGRTTSIIPMKWGERHLQEERDHLLPLPSKIIC